MTASTHRIPSRRIAFLIGLLALTGLVAQARTTSKQAPAPEDQTLASPAPSPRPRIDAVFVLDTTGSMSGLIEAAKQTIWSVASAMADGKPTPEIRIGLVAYRDRGDEYVTRHLDLTEDLDAVYATLSAFGAGGGGDGPESVNQALHEAVTRMSWSSDEHAYKVVFLVGDAPPHMDYENDVAYAVTADLARRRHIAINAIQCGTLGETARYWRDIARLGAGRFASIGPDGGALALASPVDDELARLGSELAGTVIAYGEPEEAAAIERKLASSRIAAPTVRAARLGFLAKQGGRAVSGRRDLVDAVKDGVVKLDEIAAEELPAPLRALDAAAREAYVQQQLAEREALQSRIAALSQERDAYLRKERERRDAEGEAAGFDREILGAVRDQAAAAGIAYE